MKTLLSFILLSVFSFSSKAKGSYMIVAICSDGILIGEDSRLSFFKPNVKFYDGSVNSNEIVGYCDSIQKIYTMQHFAFCSTGKFLLGENFIPFFLNQFVQSFPSGEVYVRDVINDIDTFFKDKFPDQLENFRSLETVASGYQNNVPFISLMHDGTKTTFNKGFFDSNDWSGFSELYDSAATCEKMALIIEKIITKEIDKGVNKTLGKPVMILRITTDNHFEWLRNKPLKPIMHTMRDLYTLYKQKKITLSFISIEEENNFKKSFLKK